MDLKAGLTLIPPSVKNSNCSHSRYTTQSLMYNIGFIETIEALLILILTLGVVGANALIIFVINNRRYTSYIPQQPRYLLTSLALNDLAIGLLITPFGLIPALLQCWPYGEIFCQIQALLRGALSQQSAVILICMAIDRYICALHPRRYQQHLSKKGCVAILSLTWIINLTIFGLLVLPKGYYFNHTGLMACEPFYSKPSYRILATCALYFPTTMVLMYCYGLSFHLSRFRLITDPATIASRPSETSLNITIKKMTLEEKHLSASTSRSMAAISLGFIVMVTPWTIQEIVTACTGSKLPRFLDFLVTWTALSNSFWNPFLYWLLNSHFRRLSKFLLSIQLCPHEEVPRHKGHCCNINSECDPLSTLPFPPPPHSHEHGIRGDLNTDGGGGGNAAPYYLTFRPDVERLSEKYWGEILERTLSSGSLYALQKSLSSAKQQDYEHEHEHEQQCEEHEQHQHDRHHHKSINFSKTNPSIATVTEQYENHDSNNLDNKRVMYISDCEEDDDDDDADDDGEGNDDDDNENNADEIRKHHKQQQQHHHCQQQQQQYQQCFNINNILKSEPKLCEHIYHDINCAKNKTPILPTIMYDISNDVSPM